MNKILRLFAVLFWGVFALNLDGRAGDIKERGVGLRFYLSHESEKTLLRILWEERHLFGELLQIDNYPTKHIQLSTTSCAVLVWKPLVGASQHFQNRIQCEVGYSWTDEASNKRYSNSRLIYSLGKDLLISESFAENPSFTFQGPAADLLLSAMKELQSSENASRFSLAKVKSYKGNPLYYITSSDESSPLLMCEERVSEKECSFTWLRVQTDVIRLSLGDNGDVFLKALCESGLVPDKGVCPDRFMSEEVLVDCDYVGITVPVATWGAVTDTSSFECQYGERFAEKKHVQFKLSSLVVRPHGGRYSPTVGIEIKGPGLGRVYKALKRHVLANVKAEDLFESEFPLSFMSLPGRPPWNMEYVSLRLSKNREEPLVGLSCSVRSADDNGYYYIPEKYDTGLNLFSCTIEQPLLKFR